MKKLRDLKMVAFGLIMGLTLSSVVVFAAASSAIASANFNNTSVIFNGEELELDLPMISVVLEGEVNVRNFMPVRAVLEAMGYEVDWDGVNNAVIVNEKFEVPVSLCETSVAQNYTPSENSVASPLVPDNQYDGLVPAFNLLESLQLAGVWQSMDVGTMNIYLFALSDTTGEEGASLFRTPSEAIAAGIVPLVTISVELYQGRSVVNEAETLRILREAGLIQ